MPTIVKRLIDFVESHPRTGWYIALIVTANLILNIVQTF